MRAGILLAMGLLAGCASVYPGPSASRGPTPIAVPFSASEIAPFTKMGTATITGQAFLKTRGGDVKPCAGEQVSLVPSTAYLRDWFEKAVVQDRTTQTPEPAALAAIRTEIGDGQGNFSFAGLPAGKYHVACRVTWEVPSTFRYGGLTRAGGWAFETVTVAAGETRKVVVTDRTGQLPLAALVDKAAPQRPDSVSVRVKARVYTAPDVRSQLVGSVLAGATLRVENDQPGWYLVSDGKHRGWIKASDVQSR